MTSIATHPDNPNLMLSSSRDKTVLVWNLTGGEDYGYVSLRAVACCAGQCVRPSIDRWIGVRRVVILVTKRLTNPMPFPSPFPTHPPTHSPSARSAATGTSSRT